MNNAEEVTRFDWLQALWDVIAGVCLVFIVATCFAIAAVVDSSWRVVSGMERTVTDMVGIIAGAFFLLWAYLGFAPRYENRRAWSYLPFAVGAVICIYLAWRFKQAGF